MLTSMGLHPCGRVGRGWVPAAVAALGFIAVCARGADGSSVEMRAGPRVWRMNPSTLKLETVSDSGRTLLLSAGQPGLGPAKDVQSGEREARWRLPAVSASAAFDVEGDEAVLRLTLDGPGSIAWPVIAPDPNVRALLLPRHEGYWVPPDDAGWAEILRESNTLTEEFSMPCWGLDLGPQTVTYLVPDPFNADVEYARSDGRIGFSVARRFSRLDTTRTWEVRVAFGEGTALAPALRYREWMIREGKFVSLAEKIRRVPRAARLPGAIHAYLWGLDLGKDDVRSWKAFLRALEEMPEAPAGSAAGRFWADLPERPRKAVRELIQSEWKEEYLRMEVIRALADLLAKGALKPSQLTEAFPGLLHDPAAWGDAVSTGFLEELKAAGIERACLFTSDLSAGEKRPQVARLADELGYTYGPYDSYDSVHPPGMKNSWETCQFDKALYEHGGLVKENGKERRGFLGVGKHLSSLAARPYVERRVKAKMALVPYSGWFIDCDAYGQFYDDFSPKHTATAKEECEAKADRMWWIATTFDLPLGSEGGSALVTGSIFVAHGILTGYIGPWGDEDLQSPKSPYWFGGYWPPEAPDCFFMPAKIKPYYRPMVSEPEFRIPLYQAAFHDSVIATNHWHTPSLKFKGEEDTLALLQQLYNVPPLYQLTRARFARRKAGILAHARFFAPLHRRLATVALTGFEVLTPDRLVQRTRFADGTELTANFRDRPWSGGGVRVPSRAIVARHAGVTTTYTPAY